MAIDYHTLKTVNPHAFLDLGFGDAEPYVGNAAQYLDSDVRRVVTGGHAWTGEGQPEAAVTVELDSAGLEALRIQLEAGGQAMYGLYRALDRAQQYLESAEADAERVGRSIAGGSPDVTFERVDITADGAVTIVVDVPGGSLDTEPGVQGQLLAAEQELTTRVLKAINYAQNADVTAKALFDRIYANRPVFSVNASLEALAYNLGVRELAKTSLNLAEYSARYWNEMSPDSWAEVPDDWSISDALGEFYDGLVPNPVALAKGDPSELVDLGGWVIPHTKLAKLWKATEPGQKALDIRDILEAGHHGGYTDLLTSTERFPRLDPDDIVLAYLVDKYYLDPDDPLGQIGLRNLGEAARLQAAHGDESVAGEDYVQRLRDLRGEVADWLRDTEVDRPNDVDVPNLGDGEVTHYASPEDTAAARALLRRLDDALGDAAQSGG